MTQTYESCLRRARKNKSLRLCPEGYCSAKQTYQVYPSAYANGYASSVCKGSAPDFRGVTRKRSSPTKRARSSKHKNKLQRWFREEWVNVCEKGDGPGGFARCGTGKGIHRPQDYPYCRPYWSESSIVSAQELKTSEIKRMCKKKRSSPQGLNGKPTRVFLKG